MMSNSAQTTEDTSVFCAPVEATFPRMLPVIAAKRARTTTGLTGAGPTRGNLCQHRGKRSGSNSPPNGRL